MDCLGIVLYHVRKKFSNVLVFALQLLEELRERDRLRAKTIRVALEEIEEKVRREHGIKLNVSHLAHFSPLLSDEGFALERKRLLDKGNAEKRELESELEKYQIYL